MDSIIPEKVPENKKSRKPAKPISIIPRTGNEVKLYVGEALNFTEKIEKFREAYPNSIKSWYSTVESIQLYTDITNDIRQAVLKLEKESRMCQ